MRVFFLKLEHFYQLFIYNLSMKKLLLLTFVSPLLFAQEIVDSALDTQVDASLSSVSAQRDMTINWKRLFLLKRKKS